jgi:peptide/nickel transport system permease protein
MLSEGVRYVERAPWIIVVPAALLSMAVFSFNLLGDALRDHLDPRLQRPAVDRAARHWWGRRRPPAGLAPSLARAVEEKDAARAARPPQ